MVICRKNGKCNHKYITNYHKLPQANLVTIDFRNNKQLNTIENLNLLKQLGIIKTTNWREYQKVIYNIYLTLFYLNYFGNIYFNSIA